MIPSEAEALALAIENGITPILLVRGWADRHVKMTWHAPALLNELAIPSGVDETVNRLKCLAVGSDKTTSARFALGLTQLAISTNSISFRDAARFIAQMASVGYIPEPLIEGRMLRFAEDITLIETGEFAYRLEVVVGKQIVAFLEQHAVDLFHYSRNQNGHQKA